MAKMQKMIAVIGMMIAMVFGFNSCTKELNIETPEQSTSWAAPKKTSLIEKNVWEEIVENFDFFFKYGSFESQVSRPIGAYGEATKVITVDSEEYLSGVKYVEGKLNTEKTDWESGYWFGTQVTRSQNFRLANAKYGADYADSWYSTDAFFQKDTLRAEFADAEWSREVRLDSTDVYNMSVEGMKGYYKVKDFIATVTNVAKVNEAFIKTLKVAKTSTLKDTLSLRYYVEPDPEDEFVRHWGEVELYKEGEKIVGAWVIKEEWTISGIREVKRFPLNFGAWAKGYDGDVVYATNVEYQTTIEKWDGTSNKALVATATNGIAADKFNSNFEVYGDKDVTLTYEDLSVTFKANMHVENVKQTIGDAKLTLINGTYYNISPYKAEIFPVYTVTCGEKSAKLELEAESNCQLRVKANANVVIENQEFKANFKAEGEKLYHKDGQYANSWDEVEYTESVETGRTHIVRPHHLSGEVNGVDSYEVEDASMLGQLKLSSIKGNANSTSKKDGNFNVKTVAATVTATFDNKKVQTIDFKVTSETTDGMTLGYAAIDFDKITGKIDTVRVNETTMQIVPKYTVPVVITKLDGKTETKDFVIYNPFYEVVKAKPQDKIDTVYTPSIANGQLIVLVERVVNDKDRTEIRTDKLTPEFELSAKSAKDMYGKDYATTYNGTRNVQTSTKTNGYWTVESVKGQVTSTLSNGSDSDLNIADYGFDSTITYKDGDKYSYTWIGKMDLSDKTEVTDAGYKTINDVYYKVSDYKENFNGTYTINGEEFGKPSDAVKRQILEAETVVDERSERVVSKKNNGFDVTTNFYKTYSFRGEKLVKTENGEITFNYSSRSHSDMIAASATGYKTTSNGVSGSTYTNTLSNGTNSTNNVYDITLSTTKIVHSYDGMTETYEAGFSAAEVSSSVATNPTSKTVDGVNYNAYAYSNTTQGTLSLDGQNVTKEASTSYDILIKKEDVVTTAIENQKYVASFKASGANLTTEKNANSWDKVTYTNGVETARESMSHDLTVKATISGAQPFDVDSKEGLTKEYKITSVTRTGNQVTTVTEGGVKKERTVQNFNATVNNGQTLNISVTTEKDLTEGMTLSHTYCESVKAVGVETNVSGNTVTLTPKVNVMLVEDNGVSTKAATGAAKAYTIESSMVGTYTPPTVREYEPKVENGQAVVYVYDVTDGVKVQVRRDPFTPSATLKAQAGTDVYAANNAFNTVYNGERNSSTSSSTSGYWTVSNKKGQITSTMNNGTKSETNVADFGFDQAITYKDGNYTYTFNGSMAMSNSTDAIVAAGTKTISGITYNVSDYKENFNMVYTIDGTTIDNLSDAVKRQILVEVEIEDLVPGTILAVNVRAVAAIWNGSKYVNADGHLDKIKGLAIVTKEHKGVYIPFAAANAQVALPSDEDIKNANYVEKDYYNSDYVAGYDTNKNGNWQLATVEDRSNQIVYFDNGTAVRSLTQKSMNTWGWASGEQTSQVGGYKIEVKDGICTVYFNDKLVKIFK